MQADINMAKKAHGESRSDIGMGLSPQTASPLQPIVDFILELDKLKNVIRKTHLLSVDRLENSAEHSWQIAMLALSLKEYAAQPIDINCVVFMLLIHDIGEIDAGDTIVYAKDGWDKYKAAEAAGFERIFGLLDEPQRIFFMQLRAEFVEGISANAKFAHALDRAMPMLLNLAREGKGWRENGVSYQQVLERSAPAIEAGCPALWSYIEARLREAQQKGWFSTI